MKKDDLERIVKATVAYNQESGNKVEFNKKYLKIFDEFELKVVEEEDKFILYVFMDKK